MDELEVADEAGSILDRDIQSRVKNNLPLIAGLLKILSKSLPQGVTILFNDSNNGVRSLTLISEKLDRSEGLVKINAGARFRSLTPNLVPACRSSYTQIKLSFNIVCLAFNIDTKDAPREELLSGFPFP